MKNLPVPAVLSGAATYPPALNTGFRLLWQQILVVARQPALLLVVLLPLLVACKEEIEAPKPSPGTITAHAGLNQTGPVGQIIALDGSASKDSKGNILTYTWIIKAKPTGSSATLTNPAQVNPQILPDTPGEYLLELTVTSPVGQDKATVKVTATTGPANDAPTMINADILTDRTLADKFTDPLKADYVVTNTIQVKGRLTVAPGVIIEFEADKGLEVIDQGALIANGTGPQGIVFTGRQKVPGFWKGILIMNYAELDYAEVTYAGSSPLRELGLKTNVGVYGFNLIEGGLLKATNSKFKNSGGYGLVVMGQLDQFKNNTLLDNSSLPLYIRADQIHKLDATSSFYSLINPKNIGIAGIVPSYVKNVTWPALRDGTKYLATGELAIEGEVNIAPGVTIEFMRGTGLVVRGMGALVAIGTATEKITFTGWHKAKGAWRGITFNSHNQPSEFNHTEVMYGGETAIQIGQKSYQGNILLWGDASKPGNESALKLTNSTVGHSAGYGLVVAPGGGYITEFGKNTFTNNGSAALYVEPNQIHRLDNDTRYHYNNGYNGIHTEGTLHLGHEVTWPTTNLNGFQIHVLDNLILKSGLKLASTPRSYLQLMFAANKVLHVQNGGYLHATGTPESSVRFTGYYQGQHVEHWQGIVIDSNSPLNELTYVDVNIGGATGAIPNVPRANILVRGKAKITHSQVYSSLGWGIYVTQTGSINPDAKTSNWFEYHLQGNYFQEI